MFTEDELRDYGRKARDEFKTVFQNCGEIIDTFEALLIDEGGLPYSDKSITELYGVQEVRVGPNGEEKHYIFYIDGRFIEGRESGEEIWVDLSFDQFNETNFREGKIEISKGEKEILEDIRIFNTQNRKRNDYSLVGENI